MRAKLRGMSPTSAPPPPDLRRLYADIILALPPMPVPDDPEDLRREIEAMHDDIGMPGEAVDR